MEELERGLAALSRTNPGSKAKAMWSCLLICTRCSSAQLPILCDTRLGEVNSAGLLVDETLGERLWPTFCHWDVNCAGASVNNVMCLDLRLSVKELEYGCDMIKTTPLGAWTSFRYPEHGLRAVRQNPVPVVPFHTEITSGKVIARGSFGEVAEAEWKGKAVAIKSLMKYNTTAAQMLDEAVIIRNLDHRNIIKLYAISERKKFWVLVMEFAEQGSLNCHGHSTLAKLRIAIEIVEALHHLHSREPPVLHRDLKPGNVLLMGDGTVKLCDFGLSRYREASALYTGLAGTPRYMASDDRVTEKSDIFSFGMLLWALLTEKVPYQGVEDRLVGRKVDQGERPPLDHDECFNSLSCGSQLTDLIGRCWHKDPEARPSAAAVVEELRSIYPVVPWTDLHFAGGQDVDGGGQPHQVLQGWWQNAPVTIEVVDMDDITCSQFLAQIAMLRNLNHANIVGLLAASEQEGKQHAGLVWESAEHDDLHPALPNADAWRALSTSMKLACVADVAEALDYLHSQSPPIIHGRISPSNVLLHRKSTTKLAGCTAARSLDRHWPIDNATRSERSVYMPWWDGEYSDKTDVFSLGVLLWELFSGKKHPTPLLCVPRRCEHALLDDPETPRARLVSRPPLSDAGIVALSVGRELQSLAERCCQLASASRPSAAEVMRELQYLHSKISAHERGPVRFAPESVVTSLRSMCRLVGPEDCFERGECISIGTRGEIHEMVLEEGAEVTTVAARTVNKRHITDEQLLTTVTQAMRLDHENVIKLKGVSEHQDGRNWLFFTELAEHRSLGHYIRKHANRLTATDKVKLALGVALGLSYLHSRNPPFACDLRLRRVVVMSDNTPKLTKFTALTPGQEAEMRMKEDVFIFGKLLWELLTERLPYADPRDTLEWWAASERNRPSLDDKRITRLRRGEKLQDLIGQCWRQEASTRPSADDLVKELAAILAPSAAEKLLTDLPAKAKVVGVLALVTFIMAKLVSGGYITLSSVAQVICLAAPGFCAVVFVLLVAGCVFLPIVLLLGMVKLCRRR